MDELGAPAGDQAGDDAADPGPGADQTDHGQEVGFVRDAEGAPQRAADRARRILAK